MAVALQQVMPHASDGASRRKNQLVETIPAGKAMQ